MIIDLCLCGYRRPGVSRRALLLDSDGRGESRDQVHIRLIHPLKELTGVGAQAFHIPTMPLGINRVEGQRGLP